MAGRRPGALDEGGAEVPPPYPMHPPRPPELNPRPPPGHIPRTFDQARAAGGGVQVQLPPGVRNALPRVGPAAGVHDAVDAAQQRRRVVRQAAHHRRRRGVRHDPQPVAARAREGEAADPVPQVCHDLLPVVGADGPGAVHHQHRVRDARCGGEGQGCAGREGTSEAAPGAVRQAVGGGCRSGWGAVTGGYTCR